MRIILTGAASFTGTWFARALADAGHHVVAPLRGSASDHDGVKATRIQILKDRVEIIENCAFGEQRFLELLDGADWDLLAHHGAETTNYRSDDFDFIGALTSNARNLRAVLDAFHKRNGSAVLLTGSVFEQNEGAGDKPLRAFSSYGLSKGLTADAFRYWTERLGLTLGKFVIPNPFGPLEEPRFCAYLINCWAKGEVAGVNTPRYVRDNIHISLLAKAYVDFANRVQSGTGYLQLNPSGYVESQGAFAQRFSREVGERLGFDGRLDLASQTEFPEPHVRINTDVIDSARLGWNEDSAWDEVADYYRHRFKT